MSDDKLIAENMTRVLHTMPKLTPYIFYGSRAKQTAHEHSDWDIAVIFSDYEADGKCPAFTSTIAGKPPLSEN